MANFNSSPYLFFDLKKQNTGAVGKLPQLERSTSGYLKCKVES